MDLVIIEIYRPMPLIIKNKRIEQEKRAMKRKLIIAILLVSTIMASSACGGTNTVSETGSTAKTEATETEIKAPDTEAETKKELTSLDKVKEKFKAEFDDVDVSEAVTKDGNILYVTAGSSQDTYDLGQFLGQLSTNSWFEFRYVLFTQFKDGNPLASVLNDFGTETKSSMMVWYDDNGNMIQNIGSETESQPDASETAPEQENVPETKAETEQKKSEAPQPNIEQSNAISKAKDYLSLTAFSHSGIIKQLEFEGFSNESATYAADNCGADWNEQAAAKAKSYLDLTSFSRSGLIEQLQFEGFTAEQAEYGATANGY